MLSLVSHAVTPVRQTAITWTTVVSHAVTCDVVCLQAALGSGSEMVMDVAPGVDWTAMVAILMAVQQVRWAGNTVLWAVR
jgi:hypothetical protein